MSKILMTLLTTLLLLTACGGGGGGGGGGSSPTTPVPENPDPPAPPEPPEPPEPPQPPPMEIEDPALFGIYPRDNSVTFESEITVRGSILPIQADDYSIFVQSGDTIIETQRIDSNRWIAESVPLANTDTVELRIFARDAQGGESPGEIITLRRSTEGTAPSSIMPGLKSGQFMLQFPGNEVRTLDAAGMELSRQPLPTEQADYVGEILSWPATNEVLQGQQDSQGNCRLRAYKIADAEMQQRTLFEAIVSPASRYSCSSIMRPVIAGENLFILDYVGESLTRINTGGTVVSQVAVPSADLGLPVPNSYDGTLLFLNVVPIDYEQSFDFLVRLSSVDPATGEQEILFESARQDRSFLSDGMSDVVFLEGVLYYSIDRLPYRLDINALTMEAVSYTGFTVVGPQAQAGITGAQPDCPSCYYAMDSSGRVALIDGAALHATLIVDSAPFVTPHLSFSDIQLPGDSVLLSEQHSQVTVTFDIDSISWSNTFDLSLTSFEASPILATPGYHQAKGGGPFLSRTKFLSRNFNDDGTQALFLYDLNADTTTRLELDYTDLQDYFGFVAGLEGDYVALHKDNVFKDFKIASLQAERTAVLETLPDSLTRVDLLARFPGPDGALYVGNRYRAPWTIYELDFDTENLREVSGPNAGEGPAFPDRPIRAQHWSVDGNAFFASVDEQWWMVNLESGDRSILFDGELPAGFPSNFSTWDLYYLESSNTLLVSGSGGIYEVNLATAAVTRKPLLFDTGELN